MRYFTMIILVILTTISCEDDRHSRILKFSFSYIPFGVHSPINLGENKTTTDYNIVVMDSTSCRKLEVLLNDLVEASNDVYSPNAYVSMKIYFSGEIKYLFHNKFSIKYDGRLYYNNLKLINFIEEIFDSQSINM